MNVANDPKQITGDPGLGDQSGLVVPRWSERQKRYLAQLDTADR